MEVVRFQAGIKDFSLLHNIQSGFRTQPAVYTGLTRGSFPAEA